MARSRNYSGRDVWVDFVVAFGGSASASSIAAMPIIRMASSLAINQEKNIWQAFPTVMAAEIFPKRWRNI